MKQLLLAGMAFLAFASSHPAAKAAPIVFDFTYTGSLVNFTVPTTDTFQILAFGAQGGNSNAGGTGGRGAEIGGDFSLSAGETLQIAVGGAGMARGGGAVAPSWSASIIIRRWLSPVGAVGPQAIAMVALVAPARAAAALAEAAPVAAGGVVMAEEVAVRSGASAVVAEEVASSPPVVMASVHFPPLAVPERAAALSQILLEAAVAASLALSAGTVASVEAEPAGLIQVGVEAAALAVVEVATVGYVPLQEAAEAPTTQEETRSWSPVLGQVTARSSSQS